MEWRISRILTVPEWIVWALAPNIHNPKIKSKYEFSFNKKLIN
ncbi:hypothetical protein [Zunongwangia endophytica]|uniref:Uncharacterized protein n=1 Tax=Zunongwangia endophytica TaxID=1808945 RepID=A0ABV8H8T3_9FLAO|nr:hypothetical protein [Zunongwangia endophytica]MDN3595790.1 hypothetical protein [Zunongwangia endophytica]